MNNHITPPSSEFIPLLQLTLSDRYVPDILLIYSLYLSYNTLHQDTIYFINE
jgi:hypothetical protein